jgi:hypothetical protein
MDSARETADRGRDRAEVIFSLPYGSTGSWTFLVPPSLAGCIGVYARIPEFARRGPFLHAADLRD